MFSKALEIIGSPIPNYFINNAKDFIKDKRFVAQPHVMHYFEYYYSRNQQVRVVTAVNVQSQGKTLVAHKLQLVKYQIDETIPSVKKAIIYMTGNCHYVAGSLPNIEPLLQSIIEESQKTGLNASYACFCQDYRGRGFNQSNPQENFNDYPMSQDAEDQAALIRKLVQEEGYKPENILILGYSYGSALALWSIHNLIRDFGVTYANVKLDCDRGFGNLFDYPLIKPFVYDQQAAQQRLHEKGMMPSLFLHDIASQLPDSFVSSVEGDGTTVEHISLVEKVEQEKMPGRVWVADVEESSKWNPHFAKHSAIHLKFILELQPHHFITAIINELPIELIFNSQFPEQDGRQVQGYSLKNGASIGHDDFIELPKLSEIKDETREPSPDISIKVSVKAISVLISKLHEYCRARSQQAVESEQGSNHNKSWLGQTGMVGWTAKDQIQLAIRLMVNLVGGRGPNIEVIKSLQQEQGPHHSGSLQKIYIEIKNFIEEYERLQQFNAWVISMDPRRKLRMQIESERAIDLFGLFTPNASIGHWTFIDNKITQTHEEAELSDWVVIEEGIDNTPKASMS